MMSFLSMVYNLSLQQWSYIATIVTLIFIYREIRAKRKQEKRERSFYFIQRLYDNDLYEHGFDAMEFLRRDFMSPEEKWRTSFVDKDINKSLRMYLNYYEDLGLAYNKNVLDKDIIEKSMGEASLYTFDVIDWYVKRFQVDDLDDDPDTPEELLTYIQWTKMNKAISKSREKRIRCERLKKKLIQYYNGQF